MSAQSQNREILAYLKAGGTITQLEATPKFGCTRLASRINDIREGRADRIKYGEQIASRWETQNGKKYKRYYYATQRVLAIEATQPYKQKVETQSLFS